MSQSSSQVYIFTNDKIYKIIKSVTFIPKSYFASFREMPKEQALGLGVKITYFSFFF